MLVKATVITFICQWAESSRVKYHHSQQSWQVCFSSHTNLLHFLCMSSFPLIRPNCLFHFSPWPIFLSKTLCPKVFLSVMSAWVLLVASFYSWSPFHSLSYGLSSIFTKLNSLFSWSRRFHSFDKPVKLKYMFPHVSVKACLYSHIIF